MRLRDCGSVALSMSLIVLYIGKGKGKTSACLGQALRAKGHGYPVAFCQFIKRNGTSGEQRLLASLLGEAFRAGGLGFVRNVPDRAPHRREALALCAWACSRLVSSWLLIADEILYAWSFGLLTDDELASLVDCAQKESCNLVLSGACAPDWLLERADCVTEMLARKHPYQLGKRATVGIDY